MASSGWPTERVIRGGGGGRFDYMASWHRWLIHEFESTCSDPLVEIWQIQPLSPTAIRLLDVASYRLRFPSSPVWGVLERRRLLMLSFRRPYILFYILIDSVRLSINWWANFALLSLLSAKSDQLVVGVSYHLCNIQLPIHTNWHSSVALSTIKLIAWRLYRPQNVHNYTRYTSACYSLASYQLISVKNFTVSQLL